MIGGLSVGNFPFYVNDKVITELSSADLDIDNNNELVFGTKNGLVYGLDHLGNQLFIYEQSDSIVGFCSLLDVNNSSIALFNALIKVGFIVACIDSKHRSPSISIAPLL